MECNICGKTATYRQETSFYDREMLKILSKRVHVVAEIDDGMVEYMKTAVNSAKGSLEGLENECSMTAPRITLKDKECMKGLKILSMLELKKLHVVVL